MKVGQKLCGFIVREIVDLPDCASKGIYLVHETKGMEVFHLLNDDEENLFAFSFKTPPKDSTGAAHVLEHSVLCGSEHFPLKDPFIRLANQSIKTYLNAWTASDHTVYPASSQVKADYFNLMAVYADAVFFPLLKKEIFMQEAHRLEWDAKGKPCIQGVVYNEMKGVYSSFESAASDAVDSVMLEGTFYQHDSGGDPLVIPQLTLSKLKAFHKQYYCPANCQLFLYGNIPTEEQIAFLDKKVLSCIPKGGKAYHFPKKITPAKIKPFVHVYGPADEDSDTNRSSVLLAWRMPSVKTAMPRFAMELMFLGDILWGDDCAPVAKALLESGLGQDLAPQTSEDVNIPIKSMTVGLRGVAKGNEKKVEQVIIETLTKLVKEGLSDEAIERSCMRFSFSTREIRRFNGPYSLVLLRRSLRGWLYGLSPWATLANKEIIDGIIRSVHEDASYLKNLITQLLLLNKERSLVVVTPSSSWVEKRIRAEEKIITQLLLKTDEEKQKKQLRLLSQFQSKQSPDEDRVIPHLSVSQLQPSCEQVKTLLSSCKDIPLFLSNQETNGIVYVSVAFPVDVLEPEEYLYLSTLASSLVEIGWQGLSWDEALSKVQGTTGGMGAYIRHAHVSEAGQKSSDSKSVWFGRDWLIFYCKVVEEQVENAFSLLADCITKTDFKDTERLTDIINAMHNNGMSSVIPSGTVYAAMRSQCTKNKNAAVTEILEGLTSLYNEKRIASCSAKKTAKTLLTLFERIKKGGAVIHLTADKSGMTCVKKYLPSFIEKAQLGILQAKRKVSDSRFYALTQIPQKYCLRKASKTSEVKETFVIPGTTGFAGSSFDSSAYDTKNCIADEVLCHSLETQELWRAIRTEGGAYGAQLSPDSDSKTTRFTSYRDPNPFRSLDVFKTQMHDLLKKHFSDDEVEKAIIGCYSMEIEPRTPSSTGAMGFLWRLYGLTNAQKKRRLSWLIKIKASDLHKAALRYDKALLNMQSVVLCGQELALSKNAQTTGIIYKLPV
ncbi:MAG TPA: hypothetical protein DC014_04845 [Treponema sp.]|nr:hypothetical protein [Treponema sp.]